MTSTGGFNLLLLEFKANISFLHGGESHEVGRVSVDGRTHGIEASVSDPILEPEDLKGVGQGFYAVLLQVVMLDMSLDMEGNILVESEAALLAVVAERLKLGHDGRPGRYQLLSTQ